MGCGDWNKKILLGFAPRAPVVVRARLSNSDGLFSPGWAERGMDFDI